MENWPLDSDIFLHLGLEIFRTGTSPTLHFINTETRVPSDLFKVPQAVRCRAHSPLTEV